MTDERRRHGRLSACRFTVPGEGHLPRAPIAFNRRRTIGDLRRSCRTCYYAETYMAGCT